MFNIFGSTKLQICLTTRCELARAYPRCHSAKHSAQIIPRIAYLKTMLFRFFSHRTKRQLLRTINVAYTRCELALPTCCANLRCILQASTFEKALGHVYDLRLIQAVDMHCSITLRADAARKRCTYALRIGTFGALVIGAL